MINNEAIKKYGKFVGCKYMQKDGVTVKTICYTIGDRYYYIEERVDKEKEIDPFDIKFGGF